MGCDHKIEARISSWKLKGKEAHKHKLINGHWKPNEMLFAKKMLIKLP